MSSDWCLVDSLFNLEHISNDRILPVTHCMYVLLHDGISVYLESRLP
jgi:hypothetical protein